MLRCRWIVLAVIGVVSQNAMAREERWSHFGYRPLGMGNAFVAVADDYNSLFYNPAGLARVKEWTGELLNPGLEISQQTTGFISDAMDLQSGSAGGVSAVLDLMEGQTGKVQHIAVDWTPHLVFPGFGLGLGFRLDSTMLFHRYPTIDLDIGPKVVIPISYAFNLLEEKLSLGFGLKYRVEAGIDREFTIQDIETFTANSKKAEDSDAPKLEDYVYGGTGYGADIGLLFTPFKPLEPTIGLSVMDIGGTAFTEAKIVGEATSAPQNRLPAVNAGFSIKPYQSESRYILLATDIHAMNQPYSFSKKLNFGSELGLSRIFKAQLGLHQGYLSGGFQFDVRLLKIRAVTYTEEMGEVAGSLPDRRYALQLKLLI